MATHKVKNQTYLWAFIVANAVAILWVYLRIEVDVASWILSPRTSNTSRAILAAIVSPIVVATLNALLSSRQKAILVFWRLHDPLPGHRAFSEVGPGDPRVDMHALEKRLGSIPREPREQNAHWYKLLKKHEADPVIAESHRLYLLLRDLATLALLFALFGVLGAAIARPVDEAAVYAGVLMGIYLITRTAAARYGHGLVSNVLALEASGDAPQRRKKGRQDDVAVDPH